jgi:hypothetical protein
MPNLFYAILSVFAFVFTLLTILLLGRDAAVGGAGV